MTDKTETATDDTTTDKNTEKARRAAAAAPRRGTTQTTLPEDGHGPQGTTHDPNSITTGTEVEPDDAYPPKGEGENGR